MTKPARLDIAWDATPPDHQDAVSITASPGHPDGESFKSNGPDRMVRLPHHQPA